MQLSCFKLEIIKCKNTEIQSLYSYFEEYSYLYHQHFVAKIQFDIIKMKKYAFCLKWNGHIY